MIKPLSKDTGELVRLDLSFCGLTSDYIVRLRHETSLISGILELNVGGNPIMKEVCVFFIGQILNKHMRRSSMIHFLQPCQIFNSQCSITSLTFLPFKRFK